jgi:hypothetical protein
MNTDVTNAPFVLSERLSAVEVGQGVFLSPHSSLEMKSTRPSARWVTSREHTRVTSPER